MIGRQEQSAILRDLLERPDASRLVVLLGDPGVGKSTLLGTLMEEAESRGMRVLSLCGNETETGVAFAAVADLLRPLSGGFGRLSAGQRDALQAVLDDSWPTENADSLLFRLATLNLLTEAAAEQPLLLVLDDAHWIDHASLSVLGFVLRRLHDDPVAAVASARGRTLPAGLERARPVDVLPLGELDSRALLKATYPSLVGAAAITVLREAAGNPLAIVELGRVAVQDPQAVAMTDDLPAVERLDAVFAADLTRLPATTQGALVMVAAGADDLATLTAAAEPGFDLAVLGPAEQAGVVSVTGDRVTFRHPVVRAVAYRSANVARRRQVHQRLARILTDDPDRQVWQLAAAASAPDEEVARQLAAYGDRARTRGAFIEAARALERAVHFTADSGQRAEWLLAASGLAGSSGHFGWVEELAARVREHTDDPQLLTLADHHLAAALARSGLHRAASEAIVGVVRDAALSDPTIGWAALSVQAVLIYQCNGDRDLLAQGLSSLLSADDPESPAHPPELTEPVRLWVETVIDPFDRTGGQVERLTDPAPDPSGIGPQFGFVRAMLLGASAWLLDESALAAGRLLESVRLMRRNGALGETGNTLSALGCVYLDLGRLSDADQVAMELYQVATIDDSHFLAHCADHLRSRAAALRGDTAVARQVAEAALATLDHDDCRGLLCHLNVTLAICARNDGDPDTAYQHLRALFDTDGRPAHYHVSLLAVAELAAAAALTGHQEEARRIVHEARVVCSGRRATRFELLLHHADALLAERDPEHHYRLAVVNPEAGTWPLERARARLHYGLWLRRHRRPTDARPVLLAAAEAFDASGATVWSEQAHSELRAAGVATDAPAPGPLAALTTQEQQIVRMAAEGMTNREIGERLYLSPRTVSSHLYHVFPKLGVSARHQLRPLVEATRVDHGPGPTAVT